MMILHAIAAGAALVLGVAATACAADFPQKPIRMVVSYPAGGSTDMIARLYAEKLGQELKQSVVVDNRPGAATNIGADAVAKARPDGYTVLFGGGTPSVNSIFGPQPPFDPVKSFEPVSMIARVPFLVAAHAKAPFSNVQEMLAKSKQSPGKYTVSSAQLHLYVEMLKSRAAAPFMHVPYKGGAQATTDAIGGQVDAVFALVPVLLPHIQSGHLKALGISSRQRIAALPAVPTFEESGVRYDIGIWFGLLAPAATPEPIVRQLAEATQRIVAQEDFSRKLEQIGAQAAATTPAALRTFMEEEVQTWKGLARSMPELQKAVELR